MRPRAILRPEKSVEMRLIRGTATGRQLKSYRSRSVPYRLDGEEPARERTPVYNDDVEEVPEAGRSQEEEAIRIETNDRGEPGTATVPAVFKRISKRILSP